MTRTISATVKVRKTCSELCVLEWDDGKYGEPSEENVLKALRGGGVEPDDILDTTGENVERYLDVSGIDEDGDGE